MASFLFSRKTRPSTSGRVLGTLLIVQGATCGGTGAALRNTGTTEIEPRERAAADAAPSPAASEPGESAGHRMGSRGSSSPAPPPAPALPSRIEPGVAVIVPVPGDRPVHVVHGDATARRAIVYLHGLCGDIYAMRDWAHRARRFGTVIGLLGDEACGGERYRWSQWVPGIHARIRRALEVVAEQRRGLLDPEPLTVVGYSQGSVRAAMLVQRYPETYRHVVAAGMPVAPRPDRVGLARAIAVVGGEREPTAHMRSGTQALLQANRRARFFMLPGAAHGEYGPEGAPVMESVLEWLYEAAP